MKITNRKYVIETVEGVEVEVEGRGYPYGLICVGMKPAGKAQELRRIRDALTMLLSLQDMDLPQSDPVQTRAYREDLELRELEVVFDEGRAVKPWLVGSCETLDKALMNIDHPHLILEVVRSEG